MNDLYLTRRRTRRLRGIALIIGVAIVAALVIVAIYGL